MDNHTTIQQACDAIRDAKGIVLTTHTTPDGDGIGSQIALYHALNTTNTPVYMHNKDGVPRIYRFLDGSERVTSGEIFPHLAEIDLIISLDCGDQARLGMPELFFADAKLLNIDHHASNTCYGDLNLIQCDACATGTIVLDAMQAMHLPISTASASALYTTIITDTGNFRCSNTTAEVHELAAYLVREGAKPWEISMEVYEHNRKEGLVLLSMCLNTLEIRNQGQSAWLYVDQDMYTASCADIEDTEGFIDYGRSLSGIEIAVFLRQETNNSWKVTFRGKKHADVGAIASRLGGGGHRFAAGCTVNGSYAEVTAIVQAQVKQLLSTHESK